MIFSRFKQTFRRKPKGMSGMDNPLTHETLGTQDKGQSKRACMQSLFVLVIRETQFNGIQFQPLPKINMLKYIIFD